MLVLSRRPGTAIVIGDDVRVSVVRIIGSRVQLDIEAPDDVLILREELVERPEPAEAVCDLEGETDF